MTKENQAAESLETPHTHTPAFTKCGVYLLCFQCNGGIRLLDREQYLKNENTIIKIIKKAKGNIKVKNKDRPLNSKAREETCFAM